MSTLSYFVECSCAGSQYRFFLTSWVWCAWTHIISDVRDEASYTRVMGHMDVLCIISDGFNIYLPMGILVIRLFTSGRVGARFLNAIRLQQFLSKDDVMTTESIGQGADLV